MVDSRNKGKRGERDAVTFLKGCGFSRAFRAQQFRGTSESGDVIIPELPLIHVEVKYRFTMKIGGKVLADAPTQAQRDANGAKAPVVLWRVNHDKTWKLTYYDDQLLVWPTIASRRGTQRVLLYLNNKMAKQIARDSVIQPMDCVTAKTRRKEKDIIVS